MSDFRHAIRFLCKSPTLTAIAVMTLAIGISVNVTGFSMGSVLLLRPFDVPDIDRLVSLYGTSAAQPGRIESLSVPDYLDVREQSTLIQSIAAYDAWGTNITGTGNPERVQGFRVTGDFFQATGVKPLLGRTLLPGEDTEGRDEVVVLGHNLWLSRMGGDPHAVGRRMELDGRSYQIVGVMPKGFQIPASADLWVPWAITPQQRDARGIFHVRAVARLKPEVSLKQAQAEAIAVGARVAHSYPATHRARSVGMALLRETISGDLTAEYTRMSWAAGLFVLLIACVNVANLLLARVSARQREMSVRMALGATRMRLIRQLLSETLVLALAGSAVGLLIASWWVDLLKGYMPAEVMRFLPGWSRMGIDPMAVGYAVLLAVAASVIAGVLPAWVGSGITLNQNLRDGGRGTSAGVRQHRMQGALVVLEVVLSIVLLVCAALTVRGFHLILRPVPEAIASRTLTMRMSLPVSRYESHAQVSQFTERLLAGMDGGAIASSLPYSFSGSIAIVTVQDAPPLEPGHNPFTRIQTVSNGYFGTLGIRLADGRGFAATDTVDSAPVAIVSQEFVRRYLPGRQPLGRKIGIGRDHAKVKRWMTVVGVVGDVPHDLLDRDMRPAIYMPYSQNLVRDFYLLVRADADPQQLIAPVTSHVWTVDRDQPVQDVLSYSKVIKYHLLGIEYVAWMVGCMGLVSLVLAVVGVYSIVANAVNERTHEIGVRMALGAGRGDVLRLVLRYGLALTALGLAVGTLCAAGVARMLSSLIFGVSATDLATYTGAIGLLGLTALAACWFPARRAIRVNPVEALRQE